MRKLRTLSLLSLALSFIFVSCTKEGPEGPAGAAGPQGPAGLNGPAGPAGPAGPGITYSTWYTTVEADWVEGFSDPNDYNVELVYNRTAPSVTQAIIDQGLVLCYGKNFTIGSNTVLPNVIQLPYLENFNGQHYGSILAVGKVVFTYDPIDGLVRPIEQIAGIAYRYITVPGTTAGRGGERTYAGYTASELKAMPYDQVASLLNIPAEGTNIQ